MNATIPVGTSATEWAREHGTAYAWSCALDNHNVTRDYASGTCYQYPLRGDDGDVGYIIDGTDQLRDATSALYLIDDGATVRPFYVAGWHPDSSYVMVHAMPTNVHADGTPRVRADDGRLVDFGNWMLGPRRAYHLKVHTV